MKSVVMIGCGIQEIEAVKIAKQAGFHVIVTDRNPDAPGFEYADECVVADGKDVESIIAYVLMNKERLNIRGMFTLVNLTTTAAIVANACGLPGISPSAAVAGQNKILMKRLLAAHDIPTPGFREVHTLAEAKNAFEEFGGQVFIKPANSFGGQGTRRVTRTDALEAAFQDALRFSTYSSVLVEELVTGTFHDLNGIYYDGQFYPMGMNDSYFLDQYPPGSYISPMEHFIRGPSKLLEETQRELYSLLERATRALGFTFGPVSGDTIITEVGPMIIEITPRLHGAQGSLWVVPYSTGTCPVQAAIEVMAGQPLNLDLITPSCSKVCVAKLLLTPPGRIVRIKGVEEARNLEGILHIYMFKGEGDIIEPYKNVTMNPCCIIAVGKTEEEAMTVVHKAESLMSIETESLR